VSRTGYEHGCPGCAASACPCARTPTASSRRSETLRQARDWELVKGAYLDDGFCYPCSVQAAYGHQLGFSQIAPVCSGCRGTRPTYRWVGKQALTWAGVRAGASDAHLPRRTD
jgi:hypothetical protein